MKCPHCGSEWNASPMMANSLQSCPFCQKSLASDSGKKSDNLESVLCQIASDFGLKSLEDGHQLLGYFTDLAPNLKRECRMLKYFVDAGGHTALFNMRNDSSADWRLTMEHIVRKLVGEFVVSEDAAREVCEAYWSAVNRNPIRGTHQVMDISPMKPDAFDPKDRYQTAEGFLTALSFFEDGGHLPTPKPSTAGSENQRMSASVASNATVYPEPVPLLQSNPYKAKTKVQNLCRKAKHKTAIIGIALLVLSGICTAVFLGVRAAAERSAIENIMNDAAALVDSNCFDAAITKLQVGVQEHPDSNDLGNKLDEVIGLYADFDIGNIISNADALASVNDFEVAIGIIEAGIEKYPDSDDLSSKYDSLVVLRDNYVIGQIVAEAEELAFKNDFEGAISKLETGVAVYPESKELHDKKEEYREALLEMIKKQTLAEAKEFADIGEYETAMALIQAAQETYGVSKDYEDAYVSYRKANSLGKAKSYADTGDYPSAIRILAEEKKVSMNDMELHAAYIAYCDSYTKEVLKKTEEYVDERKINEAIDEVNAGLRVLADSAELNAKKADLLAMKPISITQLKEIDEKFWTWNLGESVDTFGNLYSGKCNFASLVNNIGGAYIEYRPNAQYKTLTGILAPHDGLSTKVTCTFRIYADDVLIYTSPSIGRKTEAFTFEVDITDVVFLKLEMQAMTQLSSHPSLIVADVQLWPE